MPQALSHWTISALNEAFVGKEPIIKFCYSPATGEFLSSSNSSHHKEIIQAYGQSQFDDYVRGIFFRSKRVIYLRQHKKRGQLILTEIFLKKCGIKKSIKIVWGREAALSLSRELRGL